jgi:thioredoxin reductase (NADPH)
VYAASEGLRTLVIERMAPGGQAGTSARIENYPGFPDGISGADLAARTYRQALRLGAEFLLGVSIVIAAPQDDKTVEYQLTGGPVVRGRTTVAAPGVDYRRIDAAGVEDLLGRGVWYGSAPGEAPRFAGRRVAIVGGANSAGQAALHLAEHADRVTLLVRAASLAKGMSRYLVDRVEAHPRISVRTRTQLRAARGDRRLTDLVLAGPGGDETLAADGLFVMVGGQPLTAAVRDWVRCDDGGYLLTGPDVVRGDRARWWPHDRDPLFLESSHPGVFVAGDVRHGSIKRVASAVGEGAMAVALVHTHLSSLR